MAKRRDILRGLGGLGVAAATAAGLATADAASAGANGSSTVLLEAPPMHRAKLVLDGSGSMMKVVHDVVAGVNGWLDEQRGKPDMMVAIDVFRYIGGKYQLDALIPWTLAADAPMLVGPIAQDSDPAPTRPTVRYAPGGETPLRDAIIDTSANLVSMTRPQDKALYIIQTDGFDTISSAENTMEVVRANIEALQAMPNFTVAFMGADIDAWAQASSIGVASAGSSLSYVNTGLGNKAAWTRTAASTQAWYASAAPSVQNFYAPDTNTGTVTTPSTNDVTIVADILRRAGIDPNSSASAAP